MKFLKLILLVLLFNSLNAGAGEHSLKLQSLNVEAEQAPDDFVVFGLKSNVIECGAKWVLFELESKFSAKKLFLLSNEEQIFSNASSKKIINETLINTIKKTSFEDLKNNSLKSLAELILDARFVKAKNLKIGQTITDLGNFFVIKKIHSVHLSSGATSELAKLKDQPLFFRESFDKQKNIYLKRIFSKEHLKFLLESVVISNLLRWHFRLFVWSYDFKKIDNLLEPKNFLKDFAKTAIFSAALVEFVWQISFLVANRLESVAGSYNLSSFSDLKNLNLLPFKFSYLLEKKAKSELDAINLLNINFIDPSAKEKISEDSSLDLNNLVLEEPLVGLDGCLIKNSDGKVAKLQIFKY